LIRRFRQTLLRLGCDHFEVYEQVGSNWSNAESAGRYVQILRFLDRKHQLAVQAAERTDPTAQAVIADFCELINFPYQQQQGLFAVGFYTSVLPVAPKRGARGELVSTVEHEVIDDPEAEKPYPGASDGPPLDEDSTTETDSITDTETEPKGEQEPALDDFSSEPIDAPAEATAPLSTHVHPLPSEEPAHINADAELETLAELEPEAELSEVDEERAHGFIEGDLLDEVENGHLNGVTSHEPRPLPKH